MGKRNRSSQHQCTAIRANVEIDYDKLAEAILNAHDKIKEKERKKQDEEAKKQQTEWHRKIGYIEYPKDEKWTKRYIHNIRNFFVLLWTTLTFKSEYADKPRVSFELMRLATESIFGFYEFLLYVSAVLMFCALIVSRFSVQSCLGCLPLGFVLVLFARFFRIARLEADNMTDKETLNTIFSANLAFIGAILAVVAIILEVT